MEREKLTWSCEKAAKEAGHESVRGIFEELAKIEKAQYDSVMKTGIWMDYQDFSLEVD